MPIAVLVAFIEACPVNAHYFCDFNLKKMKVSYNWLKAYLPLNLAPDEVAKILTAIGLEEEGMHTKGSVEGGLEGLVVGHVQSVEQHPNADRLRLATVNVGADEPLSIVCGAPNLVDGQKVVVATVGTKLFPIEGEPFKIKKGKIRGEVSMGMLCAEDEIGIGKGHDGIMILDAEAKVGQPVREVLDLKEDTIFDIGLTPNRSDATGHMGVARDLLAALRFDRDFPGQLNEPDVSAFKVDDNSLLIDVAIEDKEACIRYAGLSLTDVEVKESPDWLKERLLAIDVRPINNVVDITNFVLHELGQPLHAFDADKIAGSKVVVKKLAADTPFVTLDEQERKLHKDDLMICNAEEGMCIAGVFGGLTSGVSDSTTKIFLESACFEATSIRKTSGRHQLRTDAATRFEKGVDPNNAVYALKRAALLLKELAGAKISSEIVDVYPTPVVEPEVKLRFAQLNRIAGCEISIAEVTKIVKAMEMAVVAVDEESITVKVPTNKVDVLREIDMIEEVLRIYGFDRVPIPHYIKSVITHSDIDAIYDIQNRISQQLVGAGFAEVMNLSLVNSQLQAKVLSDLEPVAIMNSSNTELDVLRGHPVFGVLQTIAYNQNRKSGNLQFFEFGEKYWMAEGKYMEKSNLAIAITGKRSDGDWKETTRSLDFYDLKTAVTGVFDRLGMSFYRCAESTDALFQYGLDYNVGRDQVATAGLLSKELCKQNGVKGDVFLAVIDWAEVMRLYSDKPITYKELDKVPAVNRDLSLLLDKSVRFADIEAISRKKGGKLLKKVGLFDVYEDKKLGVNKRSYAVSFTFQDESKTLTKKEVDVLMDKLIASFSSDLGATLKD